MIRDFVYVRRKKDGVVLDIPRKDLDETLKRGFEIYEDKIEEVYANSTVQFKESKKIECPLCGKEFKNQGGLNLHKKTHQ